MHMVVDEKSMFREDNFSKAVAAVGEASEAAAKAAGEERKKGGKGRVAREQESDIFKIVRMIMERGYDPVRTHSLCGRVHIMRAGMHTCMHAYAHVLMHCPLCAVLCVMACPHVYRGRDPTAAAL